MLDVQAWLSVGLVLLGVVLLVFAYYLRHKAENLRTTLLQLFELNQHVNQDALDFLDQAWPILKQAGLVKIEAQINWFGEGQVKTYASFKKSPFSKRYAVFVEDMSFQLTFFYPSASVKESRWLRLIVTSFLQMLKQDLDHKHAEILISQKRLERYQLLVQHEMKNIAQFIGLLSDQVGQLNHDQDKLKLVNRLQITLPMMSERAKNTLQTMQQPSPAFFVTEAVSLNTVLCNVLAMFEFNNVQPTGHAMVLINQGLLIEAFKNIFGNFRDHKNENLALSIEIKPADEGAWVMIKSTFDAKAVSIKAERMFEPFWTTSKSGLGLGLFLTRELLNQVNSDIHFVQNAQGLQFKIQLRNPYKQAHP